MNVSSVEKPTPSSGKGSPPVAPGEGNPYGTGPIAPKTKRSPAIPAIIGIAVLLAAGLFWKSRSGNQGAAAREGAGAARSQIRTVRVVPVKTGTIISRLAITGQLRSNQNVDLNSKISGRIARVLVNEGQRVKRGQLLVVLDEEDLRTQVQNSRANLQSAQVKLEQTRLNQPSRVAALQTAVSQAKAQLSNAQAATNAARARYRQAQLTEPVTNAGLRSQVGTTQAGVRLAQAQLKQARDTANQTRGQVQAGISQAQSALRQAQAQLEQTRNGSRAQEVAQAQAQVNLAQAQLTDTQTSLNRQKILFEGGATAKANVDAAQTQYNVASANLESTRQQLSLVQAGSRTEEVRAAEQVVQQRQAELLSARAQQNSILAAESQVAQGIATVAQANESLRTAQANTGQIPANQQATRTALETLRQSEAQERQARATLVGAQSDLSQIPGIRADVPAAQAAVESAQSQLEQSEINLRNARIVSPVNGVVNTKGVDVGEYAQPGTALMNLVALDSVYFEAQVPESQLPQIEINQPAQVTVTAVSDKPVIGYVTEIIPVADQQLRQFRVRITLPADKGLTPGAFARGVLQTQVIQDTLTVPSEVVRTENNQNYLLVANESGDTATVKRQYVKTGPSANGVTQIVGGAQKGDEVIVGTALFEDGDKVKVEQERSGSSGASSASGSSASGSSASGSSASGGSGSESGEAGSSESASGGANSSASSSTSSGSSSSSSAGG